MPRTDGSSGWRSLSGAVLLGVVVGSAGLVRGADIEGGSAPAPLTYEQQVRPILKAHCFQCHGEEGKPKGKLDLRLARSMKKGGTSGEAIVPGNHEESLLWLRIDADEMPPSDKKLSEEQKATIAAWIDQGAATARPEPETLPIGPVLTEDERSFWSFQPIRRPDPPQVRETSLVRTPVDAFLLARLEAKGLSFSPEADRATLIRRATFDLTGLPPTPEEVEAFVNDPAPNAFERLVDRLLDTPEYGERWARHWLDVAGYADSDGYSAKDPERKYASKYRDYIIRAFNNDRPWDELIREQLAGDEMLKPPYQDLAPEDVDRLIATGFLRMAPDGTGDRESEQVLARNDLIAETVKIVSTSLLGLTVGCAQCHSHRYDPISHEDYYRFRALFEPAYDTKKWRGSDARLISLWTEAERKRAASVDAEVKRIGAERGAAIEELVQKTLERELAEAPEELREKLVEARSTPKSRRSDEQKRLIKEYPRVDVTAGNVSLYDRKTHADLVARFAKQTAAAEADRPAADAVRALTEVPGEVPTTFLFDRGDVQQPKQAVEPGELSVIAEVNGTPEIPVDDPSLPTTGRRLAYARHLTNGRHPLVARVLVNRVWMNHFGRGLVNTPGDFGMLGDRPTHPELLDWLADEFMSGGWTLKRVHRLLLTSTAYRQSSRRTGATEAADPENELLGRMPVRRLEAEEVRDAILAVSGRLYRRMYGPPVPVSPDESGQVILGEDNRDTAGRPTGKRAALGAEEYRRSLYIQVRRSLPLGLLEAFDAPPMAPNCERRNTSTVAPQALLMMNSDFVVAQSEAFAKRVADEAGDDPSARARRAWRLVFGVEPGAGETSAAVAYLAEQTEAFTAAREDRDAKKAKAPAVPPDRRALASFCQALLSSNGFLYVD